MVYKQYKLKHDLKGIYAFCAMLCLKKLFFTMVNCINNLQLERFSADEHLAVAPNAPNKIKI